MKAVTGWCVIALCSTGLQAQSWGGKGSNVVRGAFPSVVFPGGTRATTPGVTRFNSSVVFPAGGGPQFRNGFAWGTIQPGFASRFGATVRGQPGNGFGNHGGFRRQQGFGNNIVPVPYPVPIYGGGGGYDYGGYPPYGAYGPDGSYYGPDNMPSDVPPVDASGQPIPQQPNVIILYPQQGPFQQPAGPPVPPQNYAPPAPEPQAQPQPDSDYEPSRYLIAFKDHTIYSAVAYWVEGDTLHYFTSANTHNQVSLSLVDRPLTERLNRESGLDLRLPK